MRESVDSRHGTGVRLFDSPLLVADSVRLAGQMRLKLIYACLRI